MNNFSLPHDHGELKTAKKLHEALKNNDKFTSAAFLYKVMSDPVRLKIFWILSHRTECVINISSMLNMTSPAVSHHLRTMKESGIIESHRDGKEVYYKIADRPECATLHEMTEKIMKASCPSKEENHLKSNKDIISEVHDYLINHINERITIEKLSKIFLINQTTLKKIFKEVYGSSIAAHMNLHRMEKAEELLLSGNTGIAEIAFFVGFTSQSRFTQSFKKHFGVSPTDYRKRIDNKIHL